MQCDDREGCPRDGWQRRKAHADVPEKEVEMDGPSIFMSFHLGDIRLRLSSCHSVSKTDIPETDGAETDGPETDVTETDGP